MHTSVLAPLPVAIPLGMAAILAAVNRHVPRRLADAMAIATALATGIVCGLLIRISTAAPIVYWFGGWTPRGQVALGISFTIDPISAGLATLVSLLVLCAFVFSWRYFDSIGTLYHVLMLSFLGAMCGFSLTGDLFNLFVWFELMSAAAFALCGYKIEEPAPLQGALNFAVTNTIGAFLALGGVALLYGRTGALNMAQIGRTLGGQIDGLVIVAFALIMTGFLIKGAVVPFHFWLADAHAVAPTPVCILFSGVMVELGLYAVARVYWAVIDGPFTDHRASLRGLLLVVGVLTALLGGTMCFAQRHIKRLLAYSTISHMGLMVIGFALLRPEALAGVAVYVVGHGLSKAALFLCSGILLHRYGSVDELELHGRARRLHSTAFVFVLAGLGLAGLPPFATFLGEAAIDDGAKAAGQSWIAVVFFISAVLTAGAVFRVAGRVFLGLGPGQEEDTAGAGKIREGRETKGGPVPFSMFLPTAVLAALALAVGVVPGVRHAATYAASTMADRGGYQARVLDSAWVPVHAPEEHAEYAGAIARGIIAAAAALVLAGWTLSRYRPQRRKSTLWRAVRTGIEGLRKLHSGHVSDYVAFIAFGAAAFGIVLGLLITR